MPQANSESMISLKQAQAKLEAVPAARLDTERVALLAALGRIAAREVKSSLAIPPADNSAMDGFAVRAKDVIKGKELIISQRVPAGAQPHALQAGTAARIFTGASLPEGADAVVIQENCEFTGSDKGGKVKILKEIDRGANIRPCGQDIQSGATVIKRGQRLNAVDLSLLASIGEEEVDVYQRLKVAIFSTGDELVEPGQPLAPGQIYNSNRPLLLALCQELGYETLDCGIVEDTLEATINALHDASKSAHLILSSGGVSVGEEDHVKPAVETLGHLEMWKVQIKPGKPVAFGQINDTSFLGLPGNPVSSFVVFQLLSVPLMQSLQGQQKTRPITYRIAAGFDKKASSREEYIRVKLQMGNDGNLFADRFPNLSSGVLSSLSWADGLVRHAADTEIKKGEQVDFYPLTRSFM